MKKKTLILYWKPIPGSDGANWQAKEVINDACYSLSNPRLICYQVGSDLHYVPIENLIKFEIVYGN